MSEITRIEVVRRQIEFARTYTLSLIDDLKPDDWFRQPSEGVTHVAWQVGHLAMAQYGLCLFRIRGRQENDIMLMPSMFRRKFSRGSTPESAPSGNPPLTEIRAIFDRVYDQTMIELPDYTDEQLDAPVDQPYAVFGTKLGALYFSASHEMLHAGQIGLLRRLLGKTPVR